MQSSKENRTGRVLVTGANGALGQQVVNSFSQAGYEIIATRYGEEVSKPQKEGDGPTWIEVDVTNPEAVRAAGQQLEKEGLTPDTLVHCAGGFRLAPIDETSDEDLDFLFDTNMKSGFLLTREFIPRLKHGGFGRIVLISSKATLQPPAGLSAYTASKSGLNELVHSVAEEVKSHDININAVLPTLIDTQANREAMPKENFDKWVKPDALAEIIYSLTQPWGDPIHGALIPVPGRV